ncbi:MAG: nucleotidyltransferase domain-containing protein [Clostridiales bacterium]|nr:nucleotidyltransferase domain-containing protein [Clostridiales bacterium]
MTELKELRLKKKMTQQEVSEKAGVSLRSYVSYENDDDKTNTIKYRFLLDLVRKMNVIDEEHGILSVDQIRDICADVFEEYDIEYCYLFGSYAKGTALENSDVDLLISSTISGLKYYGLIERLREELCKKVDLLDTKQLVNNESLLSEVLKDGIKIYG